MVSQLVGIISQEIRHHLPVDLHIGLDPVTGDIVLSLERDKALAILQPGLEALGIQRRPRDLVPDLRSYVEGQVA